MKNEPPWGRRSVMRLNWVLDELFVRPEVWESVFRPFGLEHQPVLRHRTGAPLESVVQLIIPQATSLDVSDFPSTSCAQCGRNKYHPVCHGPFPAPSNMEAPMAKTREYFGTDGTAFNEIIVSRYLYKQIKDAGLKGAEFLPCRR